MLRASRNKQFGISAPRWGFFVLGATLGLRGFSWLVFLKFANFKIY